jgi:hypothetical protein
MRNTNTPPLWEQLAMSVVMLVGLWLFIIFFVAVADLIAGGL